MKEIKKYLQGEFCWVELATENTVNSKEFYKNLFGWNAVDHQVDETEVYSMFQLEKKNLGACYKLCGEMKEMGVSPHWGSYVAVDSVDDVVGKVVPNGGKIINEPMDIPEAGRMSIIQDPTGAVLGLWQAGNHIGSKLKNENNTFCWNELATTDTEKCSKFFKNVLGWESKVENFGDMVYTTFKMNGNQIGGMYNITEEMGSIPPHWLVYFKVEDCEKYIKKAMNIGAELIMPTTEIEKVGKFAVLKGNGKEVFGIIQLAY